jgi:formate/nitrite transporter FocA (FNT family)
MPVKSSALDKEERAQADEMTGVKTSVIYEAIRAEGEHELSRSFGALWWSGVIAGVTISLSVVSMGFLRTVLPDAPWAPAVVSLGYPIGFLIVILGRMQLFTENTVTPILSLFHRPTRQNFLRTVRLWGIVFSANMTGCFLAAALLTFAHVVPEQHFESILTISQHYGSATAAQHFTWGMPAGFLIASLVWILPRMDTGGEVLTILVLTYMIGLGGLSHVVAGSTELFVLVLHGDLGLVAAVSKAILPAFLGNALGGTGMFAVLTYAQVREEV